MHINYKKIREENIKKYGTDIDQYGPVLLENLYSDQTHFIFELLQNAEDAEASQVQFRLYSKRLEFEHDGRPFDEDDVRGICGLAAGTKRNDINKIGKFGIGFKSVYAHTSSPEIHSADEHFAIHNYVQPRSIAPTSTTKNTIFVFPFNHADKTREESCQVIAERLQDLGARTLLFLRNINDISFQIEDGKSGTYLRQIEDSFATNSIKSIAVIGAHDGDETEENWLVFERNVAQLIDHEELHIANFSTFVVQIAFLISEYNSNGKPSFDQLTTSRLNVFFPTERETKLGFLMQGPYMTNSARDDIRKDVPFNVDLALETGELVVDALCWLRDRDWLTIDVLNSMPLEYRDFHDVESYRYVESLFTPIYDKVLTAMKDEALIPAYGGRYISGHEAVLEGSEALRKLLSHEQLQHVLDTDQEMYWLTASDLTSKLRYYFLNRVGIEEIDADKFVRRIDRDFISRQSDDWIRRFYEFASRFGKNTEIIRALKTKPIIRLENNDAHVAPYRNWWDSKPQVYLPTEHESRFPTVMRKICNSDKSLEFLKNLGLKEPDIVDEVLTRILPKYKGDDDIDEAEHQKDIASIVRAMSVDSQQRKSSLVNALKATPFLWATNAIGDSDFRKPGDKPGDIIYFRNQTLTMYFEGNPDGWFLSSEYKQYFDDLKQLGILTDLATSGAPKSSGYVKFQTPYKGSEYFPHKRGLDGFNPRFTIDGLEFALSKQTVEHSTYIWNTLLLPSKHGIVGTVESSPVQSFPSHRTSVEEHVLSHVGRLVRTSPWMPDGHGNFVRPSELSLENLPDEFRKDNELANALGMRTSFNAIIHELRERGELSHDDERKVALVEDRSPQEIAEALKLYDEKKEKEQERVEPFEPGEYQEALRDEFNRSVKHGKGGKRFDRNSQRTTEDELIYTEQEIDDEPTAAERYELRLRRVWETKNAETRRFLYNEYGGCCQICDDTFPKRDRESYFEAVHIVPRTHARWLDDPRNALCLCADHAARWKHGERSTPEEDILASIADSQEGQAHDVEVWICGEPLVISFSIAHMSKFRAPFEVTENLST